jgi:hypothetical protein
MTTAPEKPGNERRESRLVDYLQRRVRSHRLEGFRIDVRTAIHTGSPVFLEQPERAAASSIGISFAKSTKS